MTNAVLNLIIEDLSAAKVCPTPCKLPSGKTVELTTAHRYFDTWPSPYLGFTWNRKPILAHNGMPVFAEIALVKTLRAADWNAFWIAGSRSQIYLDEQPQGKPLGPRRALPSEVATSLAQINTRSGCFACFDLVAWTEQQRLVFVEAKRRGHDNLTKRQPSFVEAALALGHQLLVVEWSS